MLSSPTAEATELEGLLTEMTTKARCVGERRDLAEVLKLVGNSVYFALTAAMDAALARGQGATDLATFARRGPGIGRTQVPLGSWANRGLGPTPGCAAGREAR